MSINEQARRLWDKAARSLAEHVAAAVASQMTSMPASARAKGPSSKLNELEASVEWESLYAGLPTFVVTKLGSYTGNLGNLTLVRDDEYSIKAIFETSLTRTDLESLTSHVTGRLIDGCVLEGTDNIASQLRIADCVVGPYSLTWSTDKPPSTVVELFTSSVTRSFLDRSPDEATVTTDWYLNGPQQFQYPRPTIRERHQRFVRKRKGNSEKEDVPPLNRPPLSRPHDEQFSRDYLLLRLADGIVALVTSVPPSHGPAWSKCLSIEYHHDAGKAPPSELCDGVSEALGFLFGRHLLRVGRTSYDPEGYPLEQYVCNPWGRDVVTTCSGPDLPPFQFQRRIIEADVSRIVERFVNRRHEFNLREVVWMVWIAHRMPVGFDLPLYASALERLMQSWFKSTRSRSKGIYMPKGEFDSLLQANFDSIAQKLEGKQYADRIVRKIKNSFQMSVNERFEVFFDELGLTHGESELRAIKARNTSAHGGKNAADDMQAQVKLGRAYQTLLNRVILKVLGHEGTYTDYSADGHPERSIEQPSGDQ